MGPLPSGRRRVMAHGWYHAGMKKIILVLVVLAIGAIIYKVLTTEVPIDES